MKPTTVTFTSLTTLGRSSVIIIVLRRYTWTLAHDDDDDGSCEVGNQIFENTCTKGNFKNSSPQTPNSNPTIKPIK